MDRVPDLAERFSCQRVSVVSDCLDRLGYRGNAMSDRLRPIQRGMVVAGFAMTIRTACVDTVPAAAEDWYRGELAAIDLVQPGDVLVASGDSGPIWGELLATATRFRGGKGIVTEGATRDVDRLIEMDFPTFVASVSPLDALGRSVVEECGVPVRCGGVEVSPGDIIVADSDGIVAVPAEVASAVLEMAEAKAASEDRVREELRRGMSVKVAFEKYGVL